MSPRSLFSLGLVSFASIACLTVGCGGSIVADDSKSDVGSEDDTGVIRHHDAAPDTTPPPPDTRPVHDTYVDPGCPDAPVPPPRRDCDPYAPTTGCPKGQACYPFVDYPTTPCEPEQYGAMCIDAGTGRQGDPCDAAGCAAGFVCVVSGAGNVCGAICKPGELGTCPDGLVCSSIDVPGYGVCL